MSELILCNPEVYALREIQKLKDLYHSALQSRLNTKKKMRDIVLHWLNVRLSQFFS